MLTTPMLLDVLQQPSAPPLSVLSLGKALFSISFFALITLIVGGKAIWLGFRTAPEENARADSTMNTSLFWGAFTFGIGLFHCLVGLLMAALSVRASAPVVPEAHGLIATAVAVQLGASVYGLLVFLVTALVWIGFRTWRARPHGPLP